MNPDGSDLNLLTDHWPYEAASAREPWSPDGTREAFVRTIMNPRGTQIFYIDYAQKMEIQLTKLTGGKAAWDPAWSPRGDKIAFTSDNTGNHEVWVIGIGAAEPTNLTQNVAADDSHPSWSPDGSQIILSVKQASARQIWMMNADGSNRRNITPWPDWSGWDPVWIK